MDEKDHIRENRRTFSKLGFAYLIYYFGFTVLSFLPMLIPGVTEGLGYLIATVLLLTLLLIWKKPAYFLDCCRARRKMKVTRLVILLVMVIAGQALFQLLTFVIDLIARIFGADAASILSPSAADPNDWSIMLYVCLGAPIIEECIFRGWLLKSFQPYGKVFAIFASALFFGLIHGHLVQSPFAFAEGLVFGYVAVEYSLLWALGLHIFNNFVLGNILPRLLMLLPVGVGDSVAFLLYLVCAGAAAIYLYVRWETLMRYVDENRSLKKTYFSFFTALGVLISISLLVILTLLVIFR